MSAAKILKRYALITVACGLYALGFNWFFVPNRFTVGGFTGVAQIINHFLPMLPVGIVALVLNIPLFILGWRKIGRDLLISSLYATAAAERACKEVQQETPLGAYAVEYLTYTVDDSARNYTAIQLTIGYRRTPEQIASMVYTTSISALHDLLTSAARSGSGELVVQVGYFDHQEEQVRAIVDQVQAMEAPEEKEPWTVNFYPEGGDVGIIEIILKKS